MLNPRSCLIALALSAASLGAQALSFGFNSGSEGWTTSNEGAQTWLASGGNAGGFLQVTDIGSDDFLLNAPAAVLGDWSAYQGGTIYFDARNVNGEAPDWAPFGQVIITGAGVNNSVMLDIAPVDSPPADGQWHRYSATLSAAAWGSSLSAVLAHVTSLTIKGEFHAGVTEVVGIDNITINAVSAVPEPTVLSLLLAGLLVVVLKRRA